ncbi:MAG TPA: aconitase/3-isopropylmalate dehydratase large subunit family protein [Candidatus Krumholzibacterium sp.]|nr:aconitase/3-isopropylmalate dehydratase large subunit family protein [Candidatus Krumholzibacterium sp.]
MGKTIIEKIIGAHAGREVRPGEIVDITIDVRAARDFGGANVVKNIRDNGLGIDDPARTAFTFDCNPGGSDQKYATNQQICRDFAREHSIAVYDIDAGIGTHIAIDKGLAVPGSTFVSTDSHANILGAIGAFGQGMGDVDIAHAFAYGRVWFKVPPTMKIVLKGRPSEQATPKDLVLAMLRVLGANGMLGYAAEVYGEVIDGLDLSGRITMASMATEMGGIIALFPPNDDVIEYTSMASGKKTEAIAADEDAVYEKTVEIDVEGLGEQASRPGHPEDVVAVAEVAGRKIGSAFIGSCTNGRLADMQAAADVLKGRKVAPGVVLKIVPSTDEVWRKCLDEGIIEIFKDAGALVGNAGCAGCAAGQIGQNGPGEVTISTGNRNFAGKQGKGEVYLASPAVVAASAVAGVIALPGSLPAEPVLFETGRPASAGKASSADEKAVEERPARFRGRVWVVDHDNIDTDMIYHNRYLTITEISEMGQYTFDNLKGWEDFAKKAKPGDIVVTGKNFGAGSSRQQAVDCFESLGISLVIAESFGAIYERNAINKGFPIVTAALVSSGLKSGDEIEVDLKEQTITLPSGEVVRGDFSEVQMNIYVKGGLLHK